MENRSAILQGTLDLMVLKTLDAIGPSLLMGGPPPTPEEIAAARAKALERGLLPRDHPAHPAHHSAGANGANTIAGTPRRAKKAKK